jgi:hypothetical protein
VCLKALAKEPAGRYTRAADLAADLQRFLDGRPVQARPAVRPGHGQDGVLAVAAGHAGHADAAGEARVVGEKGGQHRAVVGAGVQYWPRRVGNPA